jgi:hypothetical protein
MVSTERWKSHEQPGVPCGFRCTYAQMKGDRQPWKKVRFAVGARWVKKSLAARPELPFTSDRPTRRHTHAHNTSCPTMFADRKASFKQPPRHVIDKALSQEARRNKVCRYQIMRTPWPAHTTARQALEEQKRVRHILVASGSAIQRISYI